MRCLFQLFLLIQVSFLLYPRKPRGERPAIARFAHASPGHARPSQHWPISLGCTVLPFFLPPSSPKPQKIGKKSEKFWKGFPSISPTVLSIIFACCFDNTHDCYRSHLISPPSISLNSTPHWSAWYFACKLFFSESVIYYNKIYFRATPPTSPPTSPQLAREAARQAERDQHNLGSPPTRCCPRYVGSPPQSLPGLRVCLLTLHAYYNAHDNFQNWIESCTPACAPIPLAMDSNTAEFPVPLQWLQFPVHLAFAMTINKLQGQSVQHVGLDLWTSVFSHGQLYVALSCCTHPRNVKVLFPQHQNGTRENRNGNLNKTANVVFNEVLDGLV